VTAILSVAIGPRERRFLGLLLLATMVALAGFARALHAAPTGKVQGKVTAADTGEPIAYADLVLVPADTTMRKVGALTHSDGTFLLEATPGLYTLQIRALSYAKKSIGGVRVEAGALLPIQTTLASEALLQEEIIVEARARHDSERALLAARRKAATVGDAVSSEQVRKSPDQDAADVLRRVTGLSVSEGKYVFVRGLGERYSSTEVDGVRLASPEQNKRVVPLDLLPAQLLDHVVVQKTYSADRPGEFGGGDVQVHTKDFPGTRAWSFSVSQGFDEGTTLSRIQTYRGTRADVFGFGSSFRELPGVLLDIAGEKPVTSRGSDPNLGYTPDTLAMIGRSFRNIWSPSLARAIPNGSYFQTFGDEWKVFGRPLGVVQSASFSRSYNRQDERQRFFTSPIDTVYDYAVTRAQESVQLGGMAALNYRLTPSHTLHARGLWTHSADDEVRSYVGQDHNDQDPLTETVQLKRSTRLMYIERAVTSGGLEGRHEFRRLLGSQIQWKLALSNARRRQPDRRETPYERLSYYDANGDLVWFWRLAGPSREFGDLADRGWGMDATWSLPLRMGRMGTGKLETGYSYQTKERDSFYRRFLFAPSRNADPTAPPESLFQERYWDGTPGGAQIDETTFRDDNYEATQRLYAGFMSMTVPWGERLRGVFGVRLEHGFQDVRSFELFNPSRISAQGRLDDVDWLPSANVTISLGDRTSVRMAASRTLSRPDLNELSPSPALEYVGGLRVRGNPDLKRASLENYDLRIESFPGGGELLAAGVFHKRLRDPIEQVIRGGDQPILVPENSASGRNVGLELEARVECGRLWRPLSGLFLNSNLSLISSEVRLKPQTTAIGTLEHPLQGQADVLANVALSYAVPWAKADATLLLGTVGKRLENLGLYQRPDIYQEPSTTVDATVNWNPAARLRLKLSGKNLFNARERQLQGGDLEYSSLRIGRSYALGLSYGS
jgi:outer membrane receptor protein involved in Fe transport